MVEPKDDLRFGYRVAITLFQAMSIFALLMLALGWGIIWVYGKLGQQMAE